ncbi:hypothetical protein [Xanthomonas phage Xp15]|uniref:Uncharacterized protein n=1 Tax=Xanthomonas phage Xp15 TaxID=322855 RepID=Q52PL4_9CAUD|nr:tail assembly chaperone [Xanthomonas phage Xp15]AAX84860.1 hypothetical protein [Xanthomonas phage Xp15]
MFEISEQPNEKLEEGVWAEYQGGQFLIAYAGGVKFQRRMTALRKPFRRQEERGDQIDPAVLRKITCQAISEVILLDWKEVASKGEPVPYSREMAFKALVNDERFRNFVMEHSMELQNFEESEREIEGNS